MTPPPDPYPPLPARLAAGLAGLAGLLALLVGVPVALWVFVGWPLPDHLPSAAELVQAVRELPVTGTGLLKTLAVVCWIAWAQLAAATLAETTAQLRAAPTPRLPLVPGASQAVAARLVGAVALLTLPPAPRTAAALPLAGPAPAAAHQTLAAQPADTVLEPDTALTVTAPTPAQTVAAADPATEPKTYLVAPRDDLWTIAETCLGDPYRWREVYDTNRGRPQADGETLTDPDHIQPGWTLLLPADATLPSAAPADAAPPAPTDQTPPESEPAAQPDDPPSPADTTAQPGRPRADNPTVELPPPTQPAAPRAQGQVEGNPTAPADEHPPAAPAGGIRTEAAEPAAPAGMRSAEEADRDPAGPVVRLPEGGLITLSVATAVSACLAAARLLARRRSPLRTPAAGLDRRDPLAGAAARAARRAAPEADQTAALHPSGTPRPAVLAAGIRDGQPVTIDPAAGPIRLAGPAPAVDAAARGLLVAYLSVAHPLDATVTIAGTALADRLLGDSDPFPGLTTAATLSQALAAAEVELLTRIRLLDLDGHTDRAALLAADTRETMPLLLLVIDHDPASRQRLDTLLSIGRRVGITALLLGDPTADATTIDQAGVVADPGARYHLAAATLTTLSAGEAADLLGVVAAARATSTHAPPLDTSTDADDDPVRDEDLSDEHTAIPDDLAAFAVPAATGDTDPPIQVTLLGAPRIDGPAGELRTGLRGKARELLAYLLLHPEGVTVDTARDVLWPDADPDRIDGIWRTTLSNLQTTLRRHAGLDPAARPIDRTGHRLRPNPDLIDADLWRLQTALAVARTDDPGTAAAALQQAVDLYRGDLCDGEHYEWAEPAREDLRRRVVDAASRLARHRHTAGDLDAAADALDRAAAIDPYNEPLHQQLMRLHAQRGHPEAVTATYQRLTGRLAELDLDPDPSTEQLHRELLGHRPGTAPALREHARRLTPARPVAQRPNHPRAS